MIYEEFKGFKFVKVGEFKLGDTAYKYGQKSKKGETLWECPTLCKLTDPNFLNASSSTYIVTLGKKPTVRDILYVGMYTETLNNRWFQNKEHEECSLSWHSDNLDNNINLLLKKLHNIPTDKEWTSKKQEQLQSVLENHMGLNSRVDSKQPADKKISLWLTVDPYQKGSNNKELNISTSIEQYFLENYDESMMPLPFNAKGKNKPKGLSVKDIILANTNSHQTC